MKDAQKPDHISLSTLVERLRDGRYVIPDFQRDFEWEPWDISALMRSIFLDYYIGSLLLWKGKKETFDALACQPIYAYKEEKDSREYIVLDGQQRLTAMYYAFMTPDAPAPRRNNRFRYFIRVDQFMKEAYDEAFTYDWTLKGEKLAIDRNKQFREHIFPLAIIGEKGWALPNWVQAYERYWQDEAQRHQDAGDEEKTTQARVCAENAKVFGEHLKDITEKYQIAYIELDRDLDLDKVCDIFTQINSRGIRLDVFDLINALLRPKGLQLRYMWKEAASRLNFVTTDRLNVYVLQVMSILLQSYCSPKYLYYLLPGQVKQVRESGGNLHKEVLVADTGEFERRWHQAIDAIDHAIKLLRHPREFGAIASQYLPYVSILPAFAALQEEVKSLEQTKKLDAQHKIRQWYWASVFLNRYSGSVESTAARDVQDLKVWFVDDQKEPGLIAEFRERFGALDLRRETRRGTSVYNGIFNLLVLKGARDWLTGNQVTGDDLDDHHIVPKSKAKSLGIGSEIDSVLNRSPLSGETNRQGIRDRLPHEYLPDLIAANGEAVMREVFETHLISPAAFDILLRKNFTAGDYEDFLVERQRTVLEAIEDLLIKARVNLPVRLREVDGKIEGVELALRKTVQEVLNNDPRNIPHHILQNIEERQKQAARKNPGLNQQLMDSLDMHLEYADLRELQDIIVNKALWPGFQGRFISKEILVNRFSQLAELRNSIRHSRQVDEVTRKDGEAAILWFQSVLTRSDGDMEKKV